MTQQYRTVLDLELDDWLDPVTGGWWKLTLSDTPFVISDDYSTSNANFDETPTFPFFIPTLASDGKLSMPPAGGFMNPCSTPTFMER